MFTGFVLYLMWAFTYVIYLFFNIYIKKKLNVFLSLFYITKLKPGIIFSVMDYHKPSSSLIPSQWLIRKTLESSTMLSFAVETNSVNKSCMTYLRPLLQQQLHTVSISDHTSTVQGLKCAMHPVHISSLRHRGDNDRNIMDCTTIESQASL